MGRPRHLAIALSLAACSFSAACYPTYAPPMRSGGFGAAGRVEGGEVTGGLSPSVRGFDKAFRLGVDPNVVVGVNDAVAVEFGGSFAVKQQATGFGGVRLTIPESVTRRGLAVDFGLGGGAGAGGVRCGDKGIDYEAEAEDSGLFDEDPNCEGATSTDNWDGLHWQGDRNVVRSKMVQV